MKGNDEMKNGKLQVALIGCGMIGHGHAEGVARDGRAEIAAVVYGKNREAAEDFAEKYGIPFVTNDYREVIERGGIDIAIVATPNACHAEATTAFKISGSIFKTQQFTRRDIKRFGKILAEKWQNIGKNLATQKFDCVII